MPAKAKKDAPPPNLDWLPETVTEAQMAALLGIATRNVRDWASRGVLVKAGPRKGYKTVESLHNYLGSMRDQAAGRATTGGRTLADEKAEDVRIGRQIKELKLAQLRGDVLTVAEVSESWSGFATAVRAAVLGLPGKARSTIPHLTAHDAEVLKRLCRNALSDLAEEVKGVVVGADEKKIRRK
jgi:phage terminase Nu1 subunit (DNA packaging protein)